MLGKGSPATDLQCCRASAASGAVCTAFRPRVCRSGVKGSRCGWHALGSLWRCTDGGSDRGCFRVPAGQVFFGGARGPAYAGMEYSSSLWGDRGTCGASAPRTSPEGSQESRDLPAAWRRRCGASRNWSYCCGIELFEDRGPYRHRIGARGRCTSGCWRSVYGHKSSRALSPSADGSGYPGCTGKTGGSCRGTSTWSCSPATPCCSATATGTTSCCSNP